MSAASKGFAGYPKAAKAFSIASWLASPSISTVLFAKFTCTFSTPDICKTAVSTVLTQLAQ